MEEEKTAVSQSLPCGDAKSAAGEVQPSASGWSPIGFILEYDTMEPGDVGFIINVPGGVVDINDLRKAAAAPAMYEALRWFIDDIDGTHTVMVDFDANVLRARAAIAAVERRS